MAISKATGKSVAVAAKGDLVVGSATNDAAVLGVGENGTTIVADSSATTGLRWQGNQAAGRNAIINGAMDFWQRGTSFTSASVYTADRWFKGSQSGCTISRQTASLEGFQYSMRVQRDSGTTNTNGMPIFHNIETQESLRFAGKTVVVSFYAKCGANYSPTSSLLNYILYTGTGTDQARTQSVAFTGEAQPASGTVTLTTSWQRFSFTATIASTATEICFAPQMNNTGTASTNDWFEITGVQLELGSVATTFSRAGGTIAGELGLCQRYYYLVVTNDSRGLIGGGQYNGATVVDGLVPFPTTMRTEPTLVSTSGTNYYIFRANATDDSFDSVTIMGEVTTNMGGVYTTSGVSGTSGHSGNLYTGNTAASVAFSAEL